MNRHRPNLSKAYLRVKPARILDALAVLLGKTRVSIASEAILAYAKKHGITPRMVRPDGTIADPRSSYDTGVPDEPTPEALESGYAEERDQASDYRDRLKNR